MSAPWSGVLTLYKFNVRIAHRLPMFLLCKVNFIYFNK